MSDLNWNGQFQSFDVIKEKVLCVNLNVNFLNGLNNFSDVIEILGSKIEGPNSKLLIY